MSLFIVNPFSPPLKGCQHHIHHIASPLQRGMWAWTVNIEGFSICIRWQEKHVVKSEGVY